MRRRRVHRQCDQQNFTTWTSRLIVVAIVLVPILGVVHAQEHKQTIWPDKTWNVAKSPEAAGWSAEKLAIAKAYGNSIRTSAVMIVQGGEVVDQWGDFDCIYLSSEAAPVGAKSYRCCHR
jgi:hypothetical protein